MEANQLAVEYLGHTFKVTATSMDTVTITSTDDSTPFAINGIKYSLLAFGAWKYNRWSPSGVNLRRDPFTTQPPTEAAQAEAYRIVRSILELDVDGNFEFLEAGHVLNMTNKIERLEHEIADRKAEIAFMRSSIDNVKKVLAP